LTVPDENGKQWPQVISCWEVSPEEFEEIKRTRKIWLRVVGEGMPPVSLHTDYPFEYYEQKQVPENY
jgi:hypothetical protein